jgi:hypothetical protein
MTKVTPKVRVIEIVLSHGMRLWFATLLFWPFATMAQEGPSVPCPDCESRINSPYPTSGPWANTDQTGSGFLLHMQNGILAGFYFGYNDQGEPEWLLFNGPLQAGEEDSTVQWELEASLSRFSGGSCPTCGYQPPADQDSAGTIHLKFYQRNHASFRFDSEDEQYMVPLLYGSAGYAHFAEQTPYLLPELGGDGENAGPWVVTFYKGSPPDDNLYNTMIVHFSSAETTLSEDTGLEVQYRAIETFSLFDPEPPVARINCADFTGAGEPECQVVIVFHEYLDVFYMPIANLGANRFYGENEEGDAVEGFRLQYD